jgi:ABC-type dipeptide/oligopeptide/nickel transport system permease subunit
MRPAAAAAAVFLLLVLSASLAAGFLAPAGYEAQFRDHPNAPPSARFLLGTDDLGRDRLARLLYGARVSLLLAPAAALLATFLAAAIGAAAGYLGGWPERFAIGAADLFVSLPWLFLLLTVRAALPLNVGPWASVAITFLLLGLLGWASAARVVRAGAAAARNCGYVVQARACGCSIPRLLWTHVLPNLRPLIVAQFWTSVPLFLLSEANLGMLGLGVAEPLPSLGNLLAQLENYQAPVSAPWLLAPALLLMAVLASLHLVAAREGAIR